MNEREWLESNDTIRMLDFVTNNTPPGGGWKPDDRQLRLFACACCRQIWHLLTDERSRRAVEVAERYADGQVTRTELDDARDAAWYAWEAAAWYAAWTAAWDAAWAAAWHAARNAARAAAEDAALNAARAAAGDAALNAASDTTEAQQAIILRDIVGNPFRPVPAIPISEVVGALAMAVYADRSETGLLAPDRFAIMADALDEAGAEELVLAHCRGPGPHVRGCWMLDAVLDKNKPLPMEQDSCTTADGAREEG